MARITYREEDNKKEQAPPGTYLVQFLEAVDRDPFPGPSRYTKDGKPDTRPRLGWRFQILQGPESGRIIDQTTGCITALNTNCQKFFRWMLGKAPGQRPWSDSVEVTRQLQTHETPLHEGIVPLKKPEAVSVLAEMGTLVHGDRTRGSYQLQN